MRMCITVRLTRWQAAFIAMAAPSIARPIGRVTTRQRTFVAIPGTPSALSRPSPTTPENSNGGTTTGKPEPAHPDGSAPTPG